MKRKKKSIVEEGGLKKTNPGGNIWKEKGAEMGDFKRD